MEDDSHSDTNPDKMVSDDENYSYDDENHSSDGTSPRDESSSGEEIQRKTSKTVFKLLSEKLGGSSSSVYNNPVGFSQKRCRKAYVRMIILDGLPFNLAVRPGFRAFSETICPGFDPPSCIEVAKDMYRFYLNEKQRLRSVLAKNARRVCIAIETWTSMQELNYMAIKAHYIDGEWLLQKKMLNFCLLPDNKGKTIWELIESCLLDWGIEKVFTITVNGLCVNDVATNYVKTKLKNWGNWNCVSGDYSHIRCCANVLNSIVPEGLTDIYHSIARIRIAVRYVISSHEGQESFKTFVEHEKIECEGFVALDVPTKWNSTYLMLIRALRFRKAFERLRENDRDYITYFSLDQTELERLEPPTNDDWEKAQAFVKIAKIFYDVTLKFSASLPITSNIYFHEMFSIQSELTELSQSGDPLLGIMATTAKVRFTLYSGATENINKILLVSTVLDPRYKLNYIAFCFSEIYDDARVEEITEGIKECLIHLYEFYYAFDSTSSSTPASNDMDKGLHEDDFRSKRISRFKKFQEEKDHIKMRNEVDRYFLEPNEGLCDDKFDILTWWKINSTRYRILSNIARDVFAIPVSTMTSESAYSTERPILSQFQGSLPYKILEALICSQNWLRSTAFVDNYIEDVEFDESFELEPPVSFPEMEHMALD